MRDTHDVRIYRGPLDGQRMNVTTNYSGCFLALEHSRLADLASMDPGVEEPLRGAFEQVVYQTHSFADLDGTTFTVATPAGTGKPTFRRLLDERAALIEKLCSDNITELEFRERVRAERKLEQSEETRRSVAERLELIQREVLRGL